MGDYGRVASIFEAAAATATVAVPVGLSKDAGSLLFQASLTGFTGTIDFTGGIGNSLGQSAMSSPLPYALPVAGQYAHTLTQFSKTTDTAVYLFLVPIVPEFVNVVMTRSAGTITMRVISKPGSNVPYTVNV
jgi:hypothetical protein